MKLNEQQKRTYFNSFEDEDILEELRQSYNSDWEIIYDPIENNFNYALIINGLEYDRLSDDFVRRLKSLC